jgi:nitroreductase/NAD-dependent dihydropyrimidine dehydrogenase PreA subunit
MENIFQINTETCNRDGICVEVCPVGIINLPEDGYPEPFSDTEDICIRCGHCVAVCPTGSFRHRDLDPDRCPPVQPTFLPSEKQIGQLFQSRRSIRVYKDRPVDPGSLQKLIEMAGWAPSAHNSRKVRWLVFGNREKLYRLAATTVDWMRWTMSVMPERAAEFHFGRRVKQWERGVDGILRGAPVLVVAHGEKEPGLPPDVVTGMDNQVAPMDYAIALSYLELAAMGLGLGTCWAGYVYKAANLYPPMHAALDLPEGHQCFGAMMVGYSRFTYRRIPQRSAPVVTWRL